MKEWILRGILISGSMIFACIVAELALTIFWPLHCPSPYYPKNLFVTDPDIGYRLNPGFQGQMACPEFTIDITINEDGIRAHNDVTPPANMTTILGLGDSYGFGHGLFIDQNLFALLEAQSGGRYMTINGSVPGYGTADQLTWLKKYGLQYRPNLVFVAMHDNDWTSDNLRGRIREQDGYLISGKPRNNITAQIIRFVRRRQLGELAARVIRSTPFVYHFLVRQGVLSESSRDWRWFSPSAHDTEAMAKKWEPTFTSLREINEVVSQSGGTTVIFVIPTAERLYDDMWHRLTEVLAVNDYRYDDLVPNYPEKVIAQFAEEHNIMYMDLWTPLKKAAAMDRQLYFSTDGHWNATGHKVAADALGGYLSSKL